jgi:hypothetical protein
MEARLQTGRFVGRRSYECVKIDLEQLSCSCVAARVVCCLTATSYGSIRLLYCWKQLPLLVSPFVIQTMAALVPWSFPLLPVISEAQATTGLVPT